MTNSNINVERSLGFYYFLFFLSGISALLYQIVWTKELALLFGVTAYAVSTTISIFMLGLALGSWFFGKKADRIPRPGLWYAMLEIGIAASAGISLLSLEALDSLITRVGFESSTSLPFVLFRIGAALLVLILPTFLMGGTLPLLARYCISSDTAIAQKLGRLYSANVLGATTGCILAGFFAIPALGMRGTLLLGVTISLGVSMLAFWRMRGPTQLSDGEVTAPTLVPAADPALSDATHTVERLMLAAFFMSGCLGLAAEVVWTRMLLLYLDATAQAFASVLAIYLLGLCAGSLLSGKLAQRVNSMFFYGLTQVLTGVTITASFFAWSEWGQSCVPMVRGLIRNAPSGLQSNTAFKLLLAAAITILLLFVPALLMGIAFPFAARFFSRQFRALGSGLGSAYMVNTLGAMMGPVVCGFLLLPRFGIQTTLLTLAIGYAACGTLLLVAGNPVSKRWSVYSGAALLALVSILFFVPDRVISSTYQRFGTVLYHEEDLSGSVAIIGSPDQSRQIMVGSTNMIGDNFRCRRYTRLIGHIPMLLHPAPRQALVICLGSGMTLSAIASHPDVESVECADLSTGIIHAAREYFNDVNNHVLEDPRVKIIVNDGRTHLMATRNKYDVIALEPPPPNNAGIANLYSKEFYELCRNRLNEGGMIAQWIPYHGVTLQQARSIVATMQAVFPTTTLWELFDGEEYCVIGHMSDKPISYIQIRDRLAVKNVTDHLMGVGVRSAEDVAACFSFGPQEARGFGAGAPLITDNKPGIGYDLGAFDLFDPNSPKFWEQVQRSASVTLAHPGDPAAWLHFNDETEKLEFQKRFQPVKLALENHNRALQICMYVKAGTLSSNDVRRDFVAPIESDPGNEYFRFSNSSGVYIMTLQQLALYYEHHGDPALAREYLKSAKRLYDQLQMLHGH